MRIELEDIQAVIRHYSKKHKAHARPIARVLWDTHDGYQNTRYSIEFSFGNFGEMERIDRDKNVEIYLESDNAFSKEDVKQIINKSVNRAYQGVKQKKHWNDVIEKLYKEYNLH